MIDREKLSAVREVFFTLVRKGFKHKYKNSYLGIIWSLLNPLANVAVFAFVFTFVIRLGVKDYPLYLFCAILPWTFFSGALTNSVVSIVENGHFVKNAPLPGILLPLSVTAVNFLNFLIDMLLLLCLLAVWGKASILWLYLPVLAGICLVLTAGMSVFLAGIFVLFRDIHFMLELFLRLFFYFVPVVYTLALVPAGMRALYMLNPLATIIDGFGRVLVSGVAPDPMALVSALVTSSLVCACCLWGFARIKDRLPERL